MSDDIDIWRAANILVKRHGADAALVAAQCADELLPAVTELAHTAPAEGKRVN